MQELQTSFQYSLTESIGKLKSSNRHINVSSKFLCLPRKNCFFKLRSEMFVNLQRSHFYYKKNVS